MNRQPVSLGPIVVATGSGYLVHVYGAPTNTVYKQHKKKGEFLAQMSVTWVDPAGFQTNSFAICSGSS